MIPEGSVRDTARGVQQGPPGTVGRPGGRAGAVADGRAAGGQGDARVQWEVRHARPPAGHQNLGAGRLVVLTERGGQVPGVQVPFGAGGAHHATHGHQGVPEAVVWEIPGSQHPVGIRPRGGHERDDVLGPGRVRQRRKLGRVLPGQLAGQALRAGTSRHQPGQPADRRLVEVLVVVVGHATEVAGQVGGPPLQARRRAFPRLLGELGRQLTNDHHTSVIRRERGPRCPLTHALPPDPCVPALPAAPRGAGLASVPESPPLRHPVGKDDFAPNIPGDMIRHEPGQRPEGRAENQMTPAQTAISVVRMPPQRACVGARAHAQDTPLAALWRLRSYLRPYRVQLAIMLAAACVSVATEIVIPLLTKNLIDSGIATGDKSLLLPIGLAAIGLGAAQAALNFTRRWVQAGAVTGMEQAMRDDLYAHLQRLHTGFHDEWQSGQLLSRATTDLSAIRRFAGFGTIFLITNTVTFVAVVALLIHLNWWLGLITASVFLPVAVASTRFERRYRVLSRRSQDQQGDLATYVEEAATGIAVLKALGRRGEAAGQHGAQASEVYVTQVSKARMRGTFWAGLDLIPNVVIGLIVLLGAIATAHHALTLGGLVAFITLTLQLVWPIEAMGYILASGQEAGTAAQRVYEILDTEPAITSSPAAAPRPRGRPTPARLRFDRVEFRYPGAERPVLRGLSLDLEPGQTLALTGATGSGKTTLLQLVCRLADPTSGSITLDGTDVRDLPLPVLRSVVGCAFEDPTLFSVSVRENVTFGAPDATDEQIEQALAVAHAGFVARLPWGLDTRIGEQGMALSGGQRQRLALARAILAKPPVLVLDDPLSALDVRTEEKVTAALRDALAGTTALIVAHRPSTVLLADRVALLADGVIVAHGSYNELRATETRYAELMSGAEHEAGEA